MVKISTSHLNEIHRHRILRVDYNFTKSKYSIVFILLQIFHSPESYPLSMNESEISSSENRNIQVENKYIGLNNAR